MSLLRPTPAEKMTATGMLASGLMMAQMTEAKALRDSVFLTNFPVTSLPTITLIAALFAIAASYGGARLIRVATPDRFAPYAFMVSGVFQIGERALLLSNPKIAACAIYLHVFAINLVLTSSFWSLMNEHYDPRSAKSAFGQIGGAGTFGGVLGGLIAERVAAHGSVPTLILVTAILHLGCGASLWGFTRKYPAHDDRRSPDRRPPPPKSVAAVVKKTPYLLEVASMMIVVSISAALIDYLFKSQAAAAIAKGPALTRFFAIFYTTTGLLGVAVQAFLSSAMLTRLGIANTVSALPLTVLAGAGWVLAFFGFAGMTALRGIEVILRGSLFRSGYEVFYTPVPSEDKRAVKAIVDVCGERMGDFIGSGILALLLILHWTGAISILALAICFSALGLVLAKRLEASYTAALETSLRKQSVSLAPEPMLDDFAVSIIQMQQIEDLEAEAEAHASDAPEPEQAVRQLAELCSEEDARIVRTLSRLQNPHPLVIQQLIRFLGDDRYAFFAMEHLRRVAPARAGQLADALLDPSESFGTRKRLPIVLVSAGSQRALDQLQLALSDPAFLIRFRSAHAMSQLRADHPELRIDTELIWHVLQEELQVSIDVWEQRRLVDRQASDSEELEKPGDASLEYLFVLLGLVLPREPVLMAFRALQTDDRHLRGTALEYLQTVMPAPAWKSLEGLIGERTISARDGRPAKATG